MKLWSFFLMTGFLFVAFLLPFNDGDETAEVDMPRSGNAQFCVAVTLLLRPAILKDDCMYRNALEAMIAMVSVSF